MNELKRKWAESFDLASDTYDHPTRRFFDLHAEVLVREARIPKAGQVLDVATGTGKVALAAARVVGSRGRVLGVDLSAGMLARAQRKAGDLPVEFRRMDAEELQLATDAFDAVLCGFAVFFFPDMVRGMREMRRVLRPGGRVVFSTFARDALEPMRNLTLARLEQYGIPRPPAPPEPWMALTEPEHLLVLLEKSGFREGRVVPNPAGYALETPDEWWGFVWGNGRWQRPLRQLPPESLARLRSDLLNDIETLRTGKGIWLDSSALFGVGVK